jgi:hypothetical protein
LSRERVRKLTVPREDVLARLFQWLDTEEGMISMKAIDDVAAALDGVDLDAKERRIVWPDGKRLTIDQAVRRIQNKTAIDFYIIENHVICWLEMRFQPNGLDEKQMEEFEVQINEWLKAHKQEKGNI